MNIVVPNSLFEEKNHGETGLPLIKKYKNDPKEDLTI